MLPNAFWESNDKYKDQKFYTAFCILEAACSDYATSVKLKRQHLLNWSCTTSYYSIMHALRLICFIEAGDFPTSHSKLAKLFINNHVNNVTTWIEQNPLYFPSVEPSRNFQFALNSLEDNKCLGKVLNKARSLRNDANYEGLLISHDYNHVIVTESFKILSATLLKYSEIIILKAEEIFSYYIKLSPRKDYWYAFLNWKKDDSRGWGESNQTGEGLYYLEASLKYKKAGKLTIKKIFSWLDDLRCTPNINMEKAKEVHDNIIMSAFGIKSKYMSDFETKINSFKELHIDIV